VVVFSNQSITNNPEPRIGKQDLDRETMGRKRFPPQDGRDVEERMVGEAGIEPALPFGKQILSLSCLPISPLAHGVSVGEPTLESGLYLSPFRFRKFWRRQSLGLREFTTGWRENPADVTDFRTGGLSRG